MAAVSQLSMAIRCATGAAALAPLAGSSQQSAWLLTVEHCSGAWTATATVATSQLPSAEPQSLLAAVSQLPPADFLAPVSRAASWQAPGSWTGTETAMVAAWQLSAFALAATGALQPGSWTGTATATLATLALPLLIRSHQPRLEAVVWATALAVLSQLAAVDSQAAWAACSEHSVLATAFVSQQPASCAEAWPASGARRRARARTCLILSGWSCGCGPGCPGSARTTVRSQRRWRFWTAESNRGARAWN